MSNKMCHSKMAEAPYILGTSISIHHLKIHVVTAKLCIPSDVVYIIRLLTTHTRWAFPVWKLRHSLWEAQTADAYPPPSVWFVLDSVWVAGHGCDSGAAVPLELNHCWAHRTNLLVLLLHPNHLHNLLSTQMQMVLGYLQQRTLILQSSAVLLMWHNAPTYNSHSPIAYALVPKKKAHIKGLWLCKLNY
jgi:hypothetical protein